LAHVSGVRELASHWVKTLAPTESRLTFDREGLSDGMTSTSGAHAAGDRHSRPHRRAFRL